MRVRRIICNMLLFAYLLGIRDGFIALWKDRTPEPVRVFPYRADSLPLQDQEALRNGIRIDSKLELLHILEDYLS